MCCSPWVSDLRLTENRCFSYIRLDRAKHSYTLPRMFLLVCMDLYGWSLNKTIRLFLFLLLLLLLPRSRTAAAAAAAATAAAAAAAAAATATTAAALQLQPQPHPPPDQVEKQTSAKASPNWDF